MDGPGRTGRMFRESLRKLFMCAFFYTFFYMKSLENDVSSASIAGQRPDASTVQCVVAVSMCPEK